MKSALALHNGTDDAAITLYYQNGSTKTVPSVIYELLVPEDRVVYDNFKNFLPTNRLIIFDNLLVGIDGDMNVSGNVEQTEKIEMDYAALSLQDKGKIDAFVTLIEKLFV